LENNLGNLVKERRRSLGLTLAALAAKSGVSKAKHWRKSEYEQGRQSNG